MRLAKSIDELYEEVKGFDLVLCNDAPLALALNNRLDTPRVGAFALTARELAGDLSVDIMGKPSLSEIELVKRISEITGYPMRYVHGEIQNFRTVRRYTPEVRSHLSRKSKNVYDEYVQLPTLDKMMGDFDGETCKFFKGKKIAVIGGELYDDLDKHFNPKFGTFEEISPFKRGSYNIQEFRELSNDRQIADNAVSLIEYENSKDVAVVMDVGGKIADAVRSALYRKNIPFINSLNVKDLDQIRDFLEFLTLSLTLDTIKVKQVRELISTYGGSIPMKFDEYLVEQFIDFCENERAKTLLQIMKNIREMKYIDVCTQVVDKKKGAQVKMLLDEMNLVDSIVTANDTDDMIYAVNNIGQLKHNEQIPPSEKEGVLLVDCKNCAYIDRPVVFFLGIGPEWEKDLSDLNMVDYRLKDDENEKNVFKFQILLQQGTARVYICNSIKGGRKPKPCAMFDQCQEKTAENFSDVCDELVPNPWKKPIVEDDVKGGDAELDTVPYVQKPFSKSSYNNYVTCPRMYMFNTVIGTPDSDKTVVGTMIHQYAEFRICYPEIAKKRGIDHYADAISERCIGLFRPELRPVKHSEIRNSICNIDRFADAMRFSEDVVVNMKKKGMEENIFFAEEGLTDGSDQIESKHVSQKSHMEGIFDVIVGSHIFDFKTGKPHDANDISKNMKIDRISDYPKEFQCMFYLSLIDESECTGRREFSLFYTNDNSAKSAMGVDFDIRENMRNVVLLDSKEEYFRNVFFDYMVENTGYMIKLNECRDMFIDRVLFVGLDNCSSLMNDDSFKHEMMTALRQTEKQTAKIVDGAIKKIAKKFSNKEYFTDGNTLFVTREYLRTFREKVWEDFRSIQDQYYNEFPANSLMKCKNCDFYDICTAEKIEEDEECLD